MTSRESRTGPRRLSAKVLMIRLSDSSKNMLQLKVVQALLFQSVVCSLIYLLCVYSI